MSAYASMAQSMCGATAQMCLTISGQWQTAGRRRRLSATQRPGPQLLPCVQRAVHTICHAEQTLIVQQASQRPGHSKWQEHDCQQGGAAPWMGHIQWQEPACALTGAVAADCSFNGTSKRQEHDCQGGAAPSTGKLAVRRHTSRLADVVLPVMGTILRTAAGLAVCAC